ncbi:hypothetical protein LTR85_004910 [Meristemomyces frigidus]|nr:hypothetical protein LTR85_004910 [Meristemomyces frigidus]
MNRSYGSNVLHDHMNSSAFPGGAYVHPPNYQQTPRFHQQTMFPYGNNQLNPSMPAFQPTGTELQRYGPTAEPTPPHTPTNMRGSAIGEMQRYVAENHMKHTSEIVHVERMARKNQQDIQDTQEMVGNDLRTLNAQLQHLQKQFVQQASSNESLAVAKRTPGILEIDIAPPKVMLEHFDKGKVAEAYLEQAEVFEETAARLRRDVVELGAGEEYDTSKMGDTKLLETSEPNNDDKNTPLIVNGSNDEMPTHVPQRRVKGDKPSRAVEIKAPAEGEAIEVKTEEAPAAADAKSAEQIAAVEVASPSAAEMPKKSEVWQPLAVRQFAPPAPIDVTNNVETFTWEFLKIQLRGEQWSPGYYFVAHGSNLKSKAYWVLEAEYEPFLPAAPGQHGAKLTAFFNSTESEPGEAPDEDNYKNTPVFIKLEGCKEYVYFGNYKQIRFSDKLDFDRVMETVPKKVREYWADQVTAEGRPEWVTRCLMEQFWPRPKYEGPIPTDEAIATPATAETAATDYSTMMERRVTKALNEYAQELKQWEKDMHVQATYLTSEAIMKAFDKADAAAVLGMRLWWEYLEFDNYDQTVYDGLVRMKGLPAPGPLSVKVAAPVKADTEREAEPKTVQAKSASTDDAAKQAMQAREAASKAAAAAETLKGTPAPSKSNPTTEIHANTSTNRHTGTKRHTGGIKPWVKAPEKPAKPANVSDEQLQAAKAFANQATRAKDAQPKRAKPPGPPHLRK